MSLVEAILGHASGQILPSESVLSPEAQLISSTGGAELEVV